MIRRRFGERMCQHPLPESLASVFFQERAHVDLRLFGRYLSKNHKTREDTVDEKDLGRSAIRNAVGQPNARLQEESEKLDTEPGHVARSDVQGRKVPVATALQNEVEHGGDVGKAQRRESPLSSVRL